MACFRIFVKLQVADQLIQLYHCSSGIGYVALSSSILLRFDFLIGPQIIMPNQWLILVAVLHLITPTLLFNLILF